MTSVVTQNLLQFVMPTRIRFVLATFTFPLVLAQFILQCFADRRVPRRSAKKFDRNCPENDASVLSIFWFWWLNG